MYSILECACVCHTLHSEDQCSYCQLPHKGSFQVSPGCSLSLPLIHIPHFCLLSSQAEVMPAFSACCKANNTLVVWVNNASSDSSASNTTKETDLGVEWSDYSADPGAENPKSLVQEEGGLTRTRWNWLGWGRPSQAALDAFFYAKGLFDCCFSFCYDLLQSDIVLLQRGALTSDVLQHSSGSLL